MKRAALVAAVLVGSIIGWTVVASYLFVTVAGLSGKLDHPWLAWWLYAANGPDGWTVALLAASGVVPPVLVAGVAYRLRMFSGRRFNGGLPRPLYGNSTWATDAEMRAGGIKQVRSR
jgi:hypothetical protein